VTLALLATAGSSAATGAEDLLLLGLVWALVCGGLGYACGAGRGRGGAGFMLGIFLGPLGWLLALFLPAAPGRMIYRARRLARHERGY
jgi:hypothetical protein